MHDNISTEKKSEKMEEKRDTRNELELCFIFSPLPSRCLVVLRRRGKLFFLRSTAREKWMKIIPAGAWAARGFRRENPAE
jgi:hypothetical protein